MRAELEREERRVAAGLDVSLRRAAVVAALAWQFVTIATVLAAQPAEPRWRLVVVHLAVCLVVPLLALDRRSVVPVGVVLYAVVCYDFYSAPAVNSALILAACWLTNLTHLGAVLLIRRWYGLVAPVAAALTTGILLQELSPIWSPELTATNTVTAVAMVVAGRFATRYLWRFVDDADDLADRVERERHETTLVGRAAREAADHARLLHDTAINTLGAIANGGASVTDVVAVRERCRLDLAVVSGVLEGGGPSARGSLIDVTVGASRFRVVRSGLDDRDLRRLEAQLSDEVMNALVGAVGELVRNVHKHAGVDSVAVDVMASDGEVVVEVVDHGVGFDGEVPAGRGLANSVRARLADVGAQFQLRTSPGAGTRARISCPLAPTGTGPETDEDERADRWPGAQVLIAQVRWRACWLWALGMIGVGVLIQAANRPGTFNATYLMLAISAAMSLICWVTSRETRVAPTWVVVLLIIAVPLAFEAGLTGIGYGTGDVVPYQAWGYSSLLIMLLTVCRSRWPFVIALGTLTITAVVTTVVVALSQGAALAVLVVVAVSPALVLVLGWLGFHTVIAQILTEADEQRRAALRFRVEAAARQAELGVRNRWRAAELQDVVDLLARIAEGSLDQRDPDVRRLCGAEEAYIRQLIQLSPDVFRVGPALTRALALAHVRSVALALRTGDVDAPDDVTAAVLGGIICDAVEAMDGGASMTVGIFESNGGALLTMVAPTPVLSNRMIRWDLPENGWTISNEVFGDQELIEIVWPLSA